ncbi:hypothetical protein Nepgr_026170 [Nepenthes gracilis]|uniref:Calcium homeostasis endoplasmic reticulum protein n=1 Tax=Nepenthes gracilis TaxID=150966 RepID=A0AAD3Y057_NEPGR|nr:hypothetical protein Nepgr_026170 [Nepenthes gracilis]
MDRSSHDYPAAAAAMAYAQQQQQATNMPQQQQFGFHAQHQPFPPSVHGPPFLPPHPSLQQFPFLRPQQPQQLHSHPPPHPHLLHLQQQPQQPPPPPPLAFATHIPPQRAPSLFSGPYDSTPPPVPPPSDPELYKRIEKLVEYSAKNGPEFEAMIREKHQDSPEYSFLFGGEGHGYYQYKLWLCTRPSGPINAPFPSSGHLMHPPPLNLAAAGGALGPMLGPPQMQRPPFPLYFNQQQSLSQPYMGHGRPDYEQSSKTFRGLSGPLPSDVLMELNNVLNNLTGTKESIKGAKIWFMQRSPFAPALAEALRDRVFALDDSEKQLHIIYLANDILFDSLQRRPNPHDLDNEALAFRPVLGPMLARIFHNPQNKEENQSRLQKILQFWASKEVYDRETIHSLEGEMIGAPPSISFPGPPKDLPVSAADYGAGGPTHQTSNSNFPQWQQDKQSSSLNHEPDRTVLPVSTVTPPPFLPNSVPPSSFSGSVPLTSALLPLSAEKLPLYPLFPPGLIPGMVKKQQIGSGVPYSPMSPLDIPTIIPPSEIPETEILERVSKFFKEIGEVNPSEGPVNSSELRYEDNYLGEPAVRKGWSLHPPPPNLQTDPDTGTYADGTGDYKPGSNGSGRLDLGATENPKEASQYDDVYTSYGVRKSTAYPSSVGARAGTR